jgi:hypothetical protein
MTRILPSLGHLVLPGAWFLLAKPIRKGIPCFLLLLLAMTDGETTFSPALAQDFPPADARWRFVRPWRERSLRVALGEAPTPADRALQELGLLEDPSHAVGRWGLLLQLRLNGTEYLRQAVTAHLIRSSSCLPPHPLSGFGSGSVPY